MSNKTLAEKLGITVDELEFIQMVDEMSTEERREFRTTLEKSGAPLPRNLYYNYETQEWI